MAASKGIGEVATKAPRFLAAAKTGCKKGDEIHETGKPFPDEPVRGYEAWRPFFRPLWPPLPLPRFVGADATVKGSMREGS